MTAEEFLKSKGYISNNHKFDREINLLIEFAKLHVKNFAKIHNIENIKYIEEIK